MSLITLPTGFDFTSHGWDIDVPQQVTRGWSKRRKVVGLPGTEMWYCTITVEPIATEIAEREWRAFVLDMQGQQNFAHIVAACQQPPVSSCMVGSGASNGYTLPLASLPASTTILDRGQYLTVTLPSGHKRLVMLMAPLITNASGVATAVFKPALSEIPTAGAFVELAKPYAPMSFSQSRNGWGVQDGISTFSFEMEESL